MAGWSGYSPNSGAFKNPLGNLHNELGYVSYPIPGSVALTDAGMTLAGDVQPPEEEELRRRIARVLAGPEKKILDVLMESRGQSLSREEIAEKSGYAVSSGSFKNPLGALRSKGFVEYPSPGTVKAAAWLFLD